MAKYISNWYGIYPNSAGSNYATDITSTVSYANDWYNYFSDYGPAGLYEATLTYISGYLYDGSDFAMYGSGFNTNVPTITGLGILTTNGWLYTYAGNVSHNVITGAQSGALNHIAIQSPTGQQFDFYGYSNVNSTTATITKITDQYADGTIVLNGALSYNDLNGTMTGNITSYQFIDNFGHSYTLSNFSIPFSQLNAYSDLNSFVADIMAGNDNIVGTAASEAILGHAGNDTLDGAAGADTLVGSTGNDTYLVDNIADIVTENVDEGIDLVKVKIATANGTYLLGDNIENGTLINAVTFNLTGNILNNVLTGNATANILNGNEGADHMIGGAGNDTYIADDVGDIVTELVNSGIDIVQSSVTYSLLDTDATGANGGNIENLTLTGIDSINGTGNAFNNVMIGNIGNNLLDGLVGNDSLNGGDGNDTLNGGLGNDTLNGGLGVDSLVGGDGNDTYIVDDSFDKIVETSALVAGGIDFVLSSANFDLSDNSNGDNRSNVEKLTLTDSAVIGTGNALANTITGNAIANNLIGNGGDDIFNGGLGNDTLDGGTGNDNMNGGKDNDLYIVDSTLDVLTEGFTSALGGGIDTVQSSVSRTLGLNFDNLTLTDTGNINATGNTLNNILIGNTGNNILNGGLGIDTLQGGAGNDTYIIDNRLDIINEELNTDTNDTVKYGVNASATLISTLTLGSLNLNTVQLTSTVSASPDLTQIEHLTITGTGRYNIVGNVLNNALTGNAANNSIDGGDGNDTLIGGLGLDTLIGGAGDDTYFVNSLAEINLTGETVLGGTDTLNVGFTHILGEHFEMLNLLTVTTDPLTLALNNINATGNAFANNITGNIGNNILNGMTGADAMNGDKGADTYIVDDIGDTVTEDFTLAQLGGIDLVKSSVSFTLGLNVDNLTLLTASTADLALNNINGTGNAHNNIIIGNAGDNVIIGDAGIDSLTGNAGNDSLDGGAGNDAMTAGLGDDTLNGGAGNDNMNGGLGSDTYIVDSILDVLTEGATNALGGGIDTVQSSVTRTLGLNFDHLILTGADNINGIGNELANELTGNTGNNSLIGGLGADTLSGGAGNDSLDGGLGIDSLTGGLGDDTYIVDIRATTTGVAPAPIIITGVELQDSIVEVNGTLDGIDTLKLRGLVTIPVASTATTLSLTGSLASIEHLDVSLTTSTRLNLTGNDAANKLTGNAVANILDGGIGADTMIGGAGNDTLLGGAGADVMEGGTGNDVYVVDDAGDTITETLTIALLGGIDTVKSSADNFTLGANIDNLTLTDGSLDGGMNPLNGTGNALNNIIIGNAGNNVLIGNSGIDTLTGNAGDDSLDGGAGNDAMTGGDGADTLNGGTGNDNMNGGAGDDTYIVDSTLDVLTESLGGGIDTVKSSITRTLGANFDNLTLTGTANLNATGNELANVLTGNDGNNILKGGLGDDTLIAGNGQFNELWGQGGNDTLIGGTGFNNYYIDNIEDIVTSNAVGFNWVHASFSIDLAVQDYAGANIINLEGNQNLSIKGNELSNELSGNSNANLIDGRLGNDRLQGGNGNDTINGGDGDDYLFGENNTFSEIAFNTSKDTLIGDAGNDTLLGGAGADTLTGGAGTDTFQYNTKLDSVIGTTTHDVITDFISGEDFIDISSIDANTSLANNQAFSFIGNDVAFSNVAGQLRFVSATNSVFGDVNGDGVADFEIQLTGVTSLVVADFIL